MNPLSLLTKGQTLKGLGRPGRYKMTPQCALPNFQITRRHTLPVSPRVAAARQESLFEQPPVKAEPPAPAPPLAELVQLPPAVISGSPFAEQAKPVEKPRRPGFWRRAATAVKQRIQGLIFGDKRRSHPGPNVQTELALEKVTVMRNNLDADDLEVVLVQRKVGTSGKPLARVSKVEMTGEAWTRLTAPFRKRNNAGPANCAAETKQPGQLRAPVLADKT